MPYRWAVLERDPLWEKTRPDPRFQAALAAERTYAAKQRALFETMRRNGEVPMPPAATYRRSQHGRWTARHSWMSAEECPGFPV